MVGFCGVEIKYCQGPSSRETIRASEVAKSGQFVKDLRIEFEILLGARGKHAWNGRNEPFQMYFYISE